MATRRMGRPPLDEMPEGERRTQILRIARDLFAQRGYAAVSLGDIAQAVGVSKAAIYHHFSSKDELYTAMLCDLLARIGAGMRSIVAAPEPLRTRIEWFARAIANIPADADMDAMMRDVAEHLAPEQRQRIAAAHVALTDPPLALMREGVAQGTLRGDPHVLAHAFVHLCAAFSGRVGAQEGFRGRREVIDAVLDLFLRGAATGDWIAPESHAGHSP